MKIKNESRFAHKLDLLFWWVVLLLPFVFFAVAVYGGYQHDFLYYLENAWYRVPFLETAFAGVFSLAFGNTTLATLFSWVVTVEILHVFVDVIAFIPRFAHKLIDYFC